MKKDDVEALAGAKLAESGLSRADARDLGMSFLTPAQTKNLSPQFKGYPSLKIQYFSLEGKALPFYRLRYLGDMNGFDSIRKKQLRYVQPADTPPEIYLPPLGDWSTIVKDPGRTVLITEGEFKAACASSRGLPTIGLGGVWSWKSARRGIGFLPSLARFKWEGRFVYLVFDSDFAGNPDVMAALISLAKELASRGARPAIVSLPDLPELSEHGKKTGLDDFLVHRGVDEFNALLEEAVPFEQAQELWRLNNEVVYIRDPGIVVVLKEGRKIAPDAFKSHAYANRHYYETRVDKEGEQHQVKKPLAPAWLAWECRAELQRITYRPGRPKITDESEYNYWPGWACEPKKGDVSMWKTLLDYMFDGSPEARTWFEQWCAYPFQHPGRKMYAATVMWGPTHGTGKSLLGYSVGKIYGANFAEISDRELQGSFNEWAENKQFIMADDVTSGEYKRTLMEELKFMITRQMLTVNAKYLPTYRVPDCINWYFTANAPDAFLLEDTDRRYFVWKAPLEAMERDFYKAYDKMLHDPSMAFPAALFHHFLHLDLSGFDPKAHALDTDAKRAMVLDSKTDIGLWVNSLREYPDSVLKIGMMPIKSDIMTASQLLQLYDPQGVRRLSAVWMGRELKRAGFEQANNGRVVMTNKGPQRFYVARNHGKWLRAAPKELAAHWNSSFAREQPSSQEEGEKKF